MLVSICLPFSLSFFILSIDSTNFSRTDIFFFLRVAEAAAPPLVGNIHDWVSRVLPHTTGIRKWSAFLKKFGYAPSVTGEFTQLNLYCCGLLVACFLLFYGDRPFNLLFFFYSSRGSSRRLRAPAPAFRKRNTTKESAPAVTMARPA